jgi:hypothetical protein
VPARHKLASRRRLFIDTLVGQPLRGSRDPLREEMPAVLRWRLARYAAKA